MLLPLAIFFDAAIVFFWPPLRCRCCISLDAAAYAAHAAAPKMLLFA